MKLKINIPGLGPVDIEDEDPEKVAALYELLAGSPTTEDAIKDQLKNNICTPNPAMLDIKDSGLDSVSVDRKTANNWYKSIYNYIKSKPNFEHDLSELMENVLGRQLHYIQEPRVYNTFRAKTRLARKNIAKEKKH